MEIAQLAADGLSSRQIAARLFPPVRTVKTHITNIFNKLGLNSRAQISRWLTSLSEPALTAPEEEALPSEGPPPPAGSRCRPATAAQAQNWLICLSQLTGPPLRPAAPSRRSARLYNGMTQTSSAIIVTVKSSMKYAELRMGMRLGNVRYSARSGRLR